MSKQDNDTPTNKDESELEKFNLFYEYIIPNENREQEAVAKRYIPRSHRTTKK